MATLTKLDPTERREFLEALREVRERLEALVRWLDEAEEGGDDA